MPRLTSLARTHRNQATNAEKALWQRLKNNQLTGYKFRRQTPIGQYIVDFFCEAKGLVIELDGSQHAGQTAKDAARTAHLEKLGLTVLRFWNAEVNENMHGVLEKILHTLDYLLPYSAPSNPPHPALSPRRGNFRLSLTAASQLTPNSDASLSPPLLGERAGVRGTNAKKPPTSTATDKPKNLNAGHRQRLRAKFLQSDGLGLADYELLELLLFGAIPQKDTKPLAKQLIQKFGSLHGVLAAPTATLQTMFATAPAITTTLRLASVLAARQLKGQMLGQTIFSSWQQVQDYCQLTMGSLSHEELRLFFLDTKNRLLAEEVHQRGTVDHTPAYPREIVKRALEQGATAIIMVHNHPHGDPLPSKEDVELTKAVQHAAAALGITLHDHLIIGHSNITSFKADGLL